MKEFVLKNALTDYFFLTFILLSAKDGETNSYPESTEINGNPDSNFYTVFWLWCWCLEKPGRGICIIIASLLTCK